MTESRLCPVRCIHPANRKSLAKTLTSQKCWAGKEFQWTAAKRALTPLVHLSLRQERREPRGHKPQEFSEISKQDLDSRSP